MLEKLVKTIAALEATGHAKTTVANVQELLQAEIERGARKTYLSRLQKETITIAKAVLPKPVLLEFQNTLVVAGYEDAKPIPPFAKVLMKGRISKGREYDETMEELNDFLMGRNAQLNAEEQALVDRINELLLAFDGMASKKKAG
jgi:hypothetical protein